MRERLQLHTASRPLVTFTSFLAALLIPCSALLGAVGDPEVGSGRPTLLKTPNYQLAIDGEGFRFSILGPKGKVIASAYPVSGLQFGSVAEVDLGLASTDLQDMTKGRVHDVKSAKLVSSDDQQAVFEVTTTAGDVARVEVEALAHRVKMSVKPKGEGLYAMLFRTGEVGPVYGLSDHGSLGRTSAGPSCFLSNPAATTK